MLLKFLNKTKIPRFYFKDGKPLDMKTAEDNKQVIEEVFSSKDEIEVSDFLPI